MTPLGPSPCQHQSPAARIIGIPTRRTAPSALTHGKRRAHDARVHLSSLLIDKLVENLRHGARLSLVVHADHLSPQLKLMTLRRRRNVLQNRNLTLSVYNPTRVDFGDAGNRWPERGPCIEVHHLLVGMLERQDDGVGGKGRERGVELLDGGQIRSPARRKKRRPVRRGTGARPSRCQCCWQRQGGHA